MFLFQFLFVYLTVCWRVKCAGARVLDYGITDNVDEEYKLREAELVT